MREYQVFINNPSSRVTIRLSCQGRTRGADCKRVLVSADTRFPLDYEKRTYKPRDSDIDGFIEVPIEVKEEGEGSCHPGVPCLLFISVQLIQGQTASVEYSITGSSTDDYALLVDGDEPVSTLARPGEPVYFLFDSRGDTSPLLTLVAKVPYDNIDQHMKLVSMYILDCPEKGGTLDLAQRPSEQNYRFHAEPNSRGQLVALVTRQFEDKGHDGSGSAKEAKNKNVKKAARGGIDHCYYRIAVVSHRLRPLTFSIRGFDWHKGAPLTLNEPIEGIVEGEHRFSYEFLDGVENTHVAIPQWTAGPTIVDPTAKPEVTLSCEVCMGKVRLKAARRGPTEVLASRSSEETISGDSLTLNVIGGLAPRKLLLEESRWMEVTSVDGSFGSYILSAEDPRTRVWLEPKPSRRLWVERHGAGIASVVWSPSKLLGFRQPSRGSGSDLHPAADYELFYLRKEEASANLSTACGLYLEHRKGTAKRIFAKSHRQITLKDLVPGQTYIVNVVARGRKSGHSTAYDPIEFENDGGQPGESKSSFEVDPYATEPRSSWSHFFTPGYAVAISCIALLVYTRPCCKGDVPIWRSFDLEMPRWQRSRQPYQPAANYNGRGSYAPPSVVGQAREMSFFGTTPNSSRI